MGEVIPKRKIAREDVVVALTGSGVSAESGVPTFRGKDGLWKQYRAEELATPEAFVRDPKLVWEWYDWRRSIIKRSKPNPAHLTLAEMERELGPDGFLLITQNVDGLHQRAGSKRVIELHGSLWRMWCVRCGHMIEDFTTPLPEIPPKCPKCGALMRPDVVWFGEGPHDLDRAIAAARTADVFLVIGTSGVVYPAASLPVMAKESGAYVIEFNIERTPVSEYADEVILGPVGKTLPEWWEKSRP